MITANELEQSWLACIDRYRGNVEAKAALLAATGVKNPSRVTEENLPAAHAALQKLLTAHGRTTPAPRSPPPNNSTKWPQPFTPANETAGQLRGLPVDRASLRASPPALPACEGTSISWITVPAAALSAFPEVNCRPPVSCVSGVRMRDAQRKTAHIVNRSSLLEILQMSQSRYERLLRDGAPVIQKENGGYEINVAEFVNFMIEDAVKKVTKGEDGGLSWDQAKRRDKIIQANIRELDLLERQNVLVEIEAFRPWIREKLGIIRSRMLVVRSQVRGLSKEQALRLEDAVNDAWGDCGQGDLVLHGD